MEFSYEMTIGTLVESMNSGGNQSKLYKAIKDTGKTVSKDLIPYIFKAAHYDYANGQYSSTEKTNSFTTIEELLPEAKELHRLNRLKKMQKPSDSKPAVIVESINEPQIERIQNVMESNPLAKATSFPVNKEEAQDFILSALEITKADLEVLRGLSENNHNGLESIYESIKQLGGRDRTNKTYYISKEIIELAAEFCENKSVKVSQFIEVAILEAIQKYQ